MLKKQAQERSAPRLPCFHHPFAVMVLQLVEMGANADGGDVRFQVTFGLAIGTCALLIALGMLADGGIFYTHPGLALFLSAAISSLVPTIGDYR